MKNKKKPYIPINKIIKNNSKYNNNVKVNKIKKNKIHENKIIIKDINQEKNIHDNIKENIINNRYSKYIIFQIICFFIIIILFCNLSTINSIIHIKFNNNYNSIIFYSYEIKLKVKGIGIKYILGEGASNITLLVFV